MFSDFTFDVAFSTKEDGESKVAGAIKDFHIVREA